MRRSGDAVHLSWRTGVVGQLILRVGFLMGLDQFRPQADRDGIFSDRFANFSLVIENVGPEIVSLSLVGIYLESVFVTGQSAVIFAQSMKCNPQTGMTHQVLRICCD